MNIRVSSLILIAGIFAACAADTEPQSTDQRASSAATDQVLGDDFVEPPTGTTEPAPGPDPAPCVGVTPPDGAAELEPFGNAVDGEMSLDWALTDFQPQSCGYETTYGMDAFKGRVTVLALLAAW